MMQEKIFGAVFVTWCEECDIQVSLSCLNKPVCCLWKLLNAARLQGLDLDFYMKDSLTRCIFCDMHVLECLVSAAYVTASCTRSSEPLWYFAAAFITNVGWKICVSVTIKYTRPRLHFPVSLSFSTCAHICLLMIKYSSLSPSLSVCLLRSLPSLSAVPKCLSDWSVMIDDWTHLTLSGPLSVFSPLSLLFPLPQRQRCLLSNNI